MYETLLPRFGSLRNLRNRTKLIETWLHSKGFRRSGLTPGQLTCKVLSECSSGGDLIRIVMNEIGRSQNVNRWAVYGPDNVLYLKQIKRDIPEALFVHIIRDGRDIALSLSKMGGFRPLPWDRGHYGLLATGLYWQWMVRKGHHSGQAMPHSYIEIYYEDLILRPKQTLAKLGAFLEHDLDYDRIRRTGLGRVSDPNSSFKGHPHEVGSSPVGRWKERLPPGQAAMLETLIGECLEEFGYPVSTAGKISALGLRERAMRTIYPNLLEAKLWLKSSTPAGRMARTDVLELPDARS